MKKILLIHCHSNDISHTLLMIRVEKCRKGEQADELVDVENVRE